MRAGLIERACRLAAGVAARRTVCRRTVPACCVGAGGGREHGRGAGLVRRAAARALVVVAGWPLAAVVVRRERCGPVEYYKVYCVLYSCIEEYTV